MKTIFNPENKKSLTYAECLGPAMEITDQRDADQYKKAYTAYTEQFLVNGKSESGLTAEQIVNTNIGYYAGYYSDEVRERVERLFNTAHPYFGKISVNGKPSPETAFNIGQAIGKAH